MKNDKMKKLEAEHIERRKERSTIESMVKREEERFVSEFTRKFNEIFGGDKCRTW